MVSNIGKKPITLPPSVALSPSPKGVAVTGPLGTTTVPYPDFVKLDFSDSQSLAVSVAEPSLKLQRSIWGRTRTLISNAIQGMTEGFSTPVYLVGVGYRVAMEADPLGKRPGWTGERLNMKVGFSHPVFIPVPDHVQVQVVTATKIMVSCTDKQALGLFAASIRKWRPPEPYKGKVRVSRMLPAVLYAYPLCPHTGHLCGHGEGQNKVCQEEIDTLLRYVMIRPIPNNAFALSLHVLADRRSFCRSHVDCFVATKWERLHGPEDDSLSTPEGQ